MRKRRILHIGAALVVIGFALLVYTFIEPFLLRVHRIDIVDEDIPASFHGTTILFAADFHHGPYVSAKRISNVVRKINSLDPDIVLLGGDYVSRDKKYIEPVFAELAAIEATLFYGAVLGNHDHWESAPQSREEMRTHNIRLLDNTSSWVYNNGARIKIGGVGDLWEDTQDIAATTNDVRARDFVVLVSHNPDVYTSLSDDLVDLMLAGHTHGGQVTLFGRWAPILPIRHKQYWRGMFSNEHGKMYVTSGVGVVTPPVRFFSRPELVVFTLKNPDC